MLKKTVTYTDPFTDQQRTEDHYFHLSKADVLEMELEEHKASYWKDNVELTGLQAHLQKMIDAEDAKGVLEEFKQILRRGYGKKVGDRFIKNTEVWQEFEGSPAYSELIFELLTNPGELASFVNGMVPADLREEAARIAQRAEKLGMSPQQVAAAERTRAETAEAAEASTPVEEGLGSPSAPGGALDEEVQEQVSGDSSGLTTQPTPSDAISDRQRVISRATAENPVILTHEEMVAMDHSTLQAGIADGRYKLS